MGVHRLFDRAEAMASPWRRERTCLIIGDAPAPARLRAISGSGARLNTDARPALGARVTLRHPVAGTIEGHVESVGASGVGIAFDSGERSVAFALAAITADMSRPG